LAAKAWANRSNDCGENFVKSYPIGYPDSLQTNAHQDGMTMLN